jgi:hypothetical protein
MGAGNGKGAAMEDGFEWYREQGVEQGWEQVMGKEQEWKSAGSDIRSRE